jgi:hypothetical protein
LDLGRIRRKRVIHHHIHKRYAYKAKNQNLLVWQCTVGLRFYSSGEETVTKLELN